VSDRLKLPSGDRISKNFFCQHFSIQTPTRSQDIRAEGVNQFSQRRAPGIDNLSGKEISTDQNSSAFDKTVGNRTLTGGDAPCKAKNHDKTSPQIGPNKPGGTGPDVAIQTGGGISVPVYHTESLATCRNINELNWSKRIKSFKLS
jgi:hypothetical protein